MDMPAKQIGQAMDEQYKCEISRNMAYKARSKARKNIKESVAEQYAFVWEYVAELQRTHPNTTIDIQYNPRSGPDERPTFTRFYCCLGPLKKGFNDGCRPIIAIDGCHTKGAYLGQLLTAIGIEPNNGWWPIAWAVVEKEAREQWHWFLSLLIEDLQIATASSHYTFISDQQKGLDSALLELLPYCEHRFCIQHMYKNFKKKHPGQPPPQHWCKAFFPHHVKSDMLVNNLCETFNAKILEYKDLPIIGMIEGIREYLMGRIGDGAAWMKKCPGAVGPTIKELIEKRQNSLGNGKLWQMVMGVIKSKGLEGNNMLCMYKKEHVLVIYDKLVGCHVAIPLQHFIE
nr:uncharacterized protein LOC113693260 [Coffea arabica]